MFAVGLGLGTSNPPPYWDRDTLKKCFEKYGYDLLGFVDQISSRPRQGLTGALLKCDVLKWKIGTVPTQSLSAGVSFMEKSESVADKQEKKSEDCVRLSVSAFTRRVSELVKAVYIEEAKKTEALGSG
jgi:hypothetical protein